MQASKVMNRRNFTSAQQGLFYNLPASTWSFTNTNSGHRTSEKDNPDLVDYFITGMIMNRQRHPVGRLRCALFSELGEILGGRRTQLSFAHMNGNNDILCVEAIRGQNEEADKDTHGCLSMCCCTHFTARSSRLLLHLASGINGSSRHSNCRAFISTI